MTPEVTSPQISKKQIFSVCLITIFALCLRIEYIKNTNVYNPIAKDAYDYVTYGYNLAFHKTFSKEYPSENPAPDSFRSPGYPMLISVFFLLNGKDYYLPLLYTQAVISALLVPLTFMLGILFLPAGWAIASSMLVALSPHLVSMAGYVLTETFFAFLLLSALVCFCYGIRQNRMLLIIESAIFFGFAYLSNETAILIPFLLSASFPLLSKTPALSEKSKKIVMFLAVFSLFPTIWIIRDSMLPPNALRGKHRVISTMIHGSYPGFIYKNPKFRYFPYREDPQLSEFGSSWSSFAKIMRQRVSERPLRYMVWYLFEKPYYLWSWNILQGQGDIYIYGVTASLYQKSVWADSTRIWMKYLHPILMFIALIGIPIFYFRYRRADHEMPLLILIVCLYYTMIYTVFFPDPRYSVPLRPYFYIWTLWTIRTALCRLSGNRWDKYLFLNPLYLFVQTSGLPLNL